MGNIIGTKDILVKEIRECRFMLRSVLPLSMDYQELKTSVRRHGILQSLLVRPLKTDEPKHKYEIVDGSWRFDVAKKLHMAEVPCIIGEFTDEEVLELQINTNSIRAITPDIKYAERLHYIFANSNITLSELAFKLNKSEAWIRGVLRLIHLDKDAEPYLQKGTVSLASAETLARVPLGLQKPLIHDAVTMNTNEFVTKAREVIKKYREDVKESRVLAEVDRQKSPQPSLRSFKVIVEEFINKPNMLTVLKEEGAKTAEEGWLAAIKWVVSMDKSAYRSKKEGIYTTGRERMNSIKLRQENRRFLEELEKQNER